MLICRPDIVGGATTLAISASWLLDPDQALLPDLGVRHLAPPEPLNDDHLVPIEQKLARLRNPKLNVVLVDLHRSTEPNLFDFVGLVRLVLRALLLGLLVLVLAKIHDLAQRRTLVSLDFDEVEAGGLGHSERFFPLDDPDELVRMVDHLER